MARRKHSTFKKTVRRRKKSSKKGGRKRRSKKRYGKKMQIKRQFKNAISRLHRMRPVKQRAAVVGASDKFIRDVSSFLSRIRKKGHLVKPSHRRILKKHKKKLRKLVHAKTPMHMKRLILSQKGGIIPALIPIIVALIGAGGSVAAGATSAAILRG